MNISPLNGLQNYKNYDIQGKVGEYGVLNSDTFKSEYLKHQVEDNYNRFLVIPIITCVIGLLFFSLNSYVYFYEEPREQTNSYFVLWAALVISSLVFRLFISSVSKKNNYRLLDTTILLYATTMCCVSASVTGLDSIGTSDLTAYSYTILGMATAYRASISKYVVITLVTFLYFNVFYIFVLEQQITASLLLPILVLNVISIFIAVSLEANRKKMVHLSSQLEVTNQRLRDESISDPLTKLYNRRYLTDYLMRKVKEFSRSKESLCVAICDLDHFKKVNDELGHMVGDKALEAFAELLKRIGRETDIHIRFGGEEFVIVMPKTNLQQALVSIERLRNATHAFEFENIPWPLTVSVGLTEIKSDDSYDSLLARADTFVYEAKSRGRNQIVVG